MTDATLVFFVKLTVGVLGVLLILLVIDAGLAYWKSQQKAKRQLKDASLFRDQQPHASPPRPVASFSSKSPKGFTPINNTRVQGRKAHVQHLNKKAN